MGFHHYNGDPLRKKKNKQKQKREKQNSQLQTKLCKFVGELLSGICACSHAHTRHSCTAVPANAIPRDAWDGHVYETLCRTEGTHVDERQQDGGLY